MKIVPNTQRTNAHPASILSAFIGMLLTISASATSPSTEARQAPLLNALDARQTVQPNTPPPKVIKQHLENVPLEYKAEYRGRVRGFSLKLKRELIKKDDKYWSLRHKTRQLFISLDERSTFSVSDNRITPMHYRFERKGLGKNRKFSINFDQQAQTATIQRKDENRIVALQANSIDTLNYQLALRLALQQQPDLKEFNPSIVDRSRLKPYLIRFEAEQMLETPLGKISTLRFKRRRLSKDGQPRDTTLWLAKNWNYFVVKIRQTEGDKDYDLTLDSLEVNNAPPNSPLAAFNRRR